MAHIPSDDLNPLAVARANESLWREHPELHGRQLTMDSKDLGYRREWMREYEAAEHAVTPPPPAQIPAPVSPPRPVAVGQPVQACPIASMTHEQKMEEAIKGAKLSPAVREALGDIKSLVAQMVVVGAILAGIAATGYGAVAEGIGAALLIAGAALSGVQIGTGINHLIDFFQQTRCDSATSPEDLDRAGKSFADGIANIGVGGLNLLISLLGARGKSPTGRPINPIEAPPPKKLGLGLKNSETDYITWAKEKGLDTYGKFESSEPSFSGQIEDAMTQAREIHFNLKDVDTARANGALNEFGEPAAGYTNYELYLLKTRPEFQAKVIWYDEAGNAMPKGWMPPGF